MNKYLRIEHQARYYILFLISQQRYTHSEILGLLVQQNIPVPTDDKEFEALRKEIIQAQRGLVPPPRYSPHNLSHVPTASWLRELKVYDWWAHESAVYFAVDVLDQPSLRREMEILLLGPLRYGEIATRLRTLHELPEEAMNLSVVRYFAHYFWNVEALPAHRWKTLLAELPGGGEDYRSVREAPRSSVGAAMSLFIATQGGSGVPKESIIFRYIRDACFMEFIKLTTAQIPGVAKSNAMSSLVSSLVAAQDQVDMRRGGSAELMDELGRLTARYDNRPLTMAAELPLHILPEDIPEKKEVER